MKKAVFLDRDGVLNYPIIKKGKPYAPSSLSEFSIIPGVKEALLPLFQKGFVLIVVTNQPDVGRKKIEKKTVEEMHHILLQNLPLTSIEVCYDELDPRYKPSPLMLENAAQRESVDLTQSYMIGDRWRDVGAGNKAGCFTIFLEKNYEEACLEPAQYTCETLLEASQFILQREAV